MSVLQQLNQPELNWPGNDRTDMVRGTDRSETPAASWPPERPTGSVRMDRPCLISRTATYGPV